MEAISIEVFSDIAHKIWSERENCVCLLGWFLAVFFFRAWAFLRIDYFADIAKVQVQLWSATMRLELKTNEAKMWSNWCDTFLKKLTDKSSKMHEASLTET